MVLLKCHNYFLPCNHRGKLFFPSGLRQTFFLSVVHGDAFLGAGEFSPMPGINVPSPKNVRQKIQQASFCHEMVHHLQKMFSMSHDISLDDLCCLFDEVKEPLSFPLSMALFHKQVMAFKDTAKNRYVKLCALIEPSGADESTTLGQRNIDQGFSCLKIKVRNKFLNDEIKKLKAITRICKDHVALRIDANRSLDLGSACSLLDAIDVSCVEYIEEPFLNIQQAKELKHRFGIDIAVDESFGPTDDLHRLIDWGVNVLIIKPSRFKSIFHVTKLVQNAIKLSIKPIFSHCFESAFTSALLSILLCRLDVLSHHHGIWAQDFFLTPKKPVLGAVNDGRLCLDWARGFLSKLYDNASLGFV